ncbi:unnamed protein product, partial [Nezara viridula]
MYNNITIYKVQTMVFVGLQVVNLS